MDTQPKKSFLNPTPPRLRWVRKSWWLIIISLLIISVGSLVFIIVKNCGQTNNSINANVSLENNNAPTSIENDVISRKRSQIESAYPEFKDFENQKSFAGQSVNFLIEGDDHYFAYLVLGSGVPVVKATCFRVDHLMRVYKIGEFPDPLDSYAGYRDVNPKNCAGIK
ncbi:MAG: hypothetical protein ABIH38_04455 [Patescibacteria group bacterium]